MKEEFIKALQNMSEEDIFDKFTWSSFCPDDFSMVREHTCDFYKDNKGCSECWEKAKFRESEQQCLKK